jgi:hypothetical protein
VFGGEDFMNLQLVDKRPMVTGASAGTNIAIAEVLSAIPRSKAGPPHSKGQGSTVRIDTETQETINDRPTPKDCRSGR